MSLLKLADGLEALEKSRAWGSQSAMLLAGAQALRILEPLRNEGACPSCGSISRVPSDEPGRLWERLHTSDCKLSKLLLLVQP